MKAEDLTGRRFGRYIVLSRAENRGGIVRWECRCDCGSFRTVQAGTLRAGTAKSCGCSQVELRRAPIVAPDGTIAIRLTKGLLAIIDGIDADLASLNWLAHKTNGGHYAARGSAARRVYLHRVIAGRAGVAMSGLEVDHKNGDKLDCRRQNLRPATHIQNMRNLRPRRDKGQIPKGVSWHKAANKWAARIKTDGKGIHLGLFDTVEAASAAYAEASRKHHGEFGRVA